MLREESGCERNNVIVKREEKKLIKREKIRERAREKGIVKR